MAKVSYVDLLPAEEILYYKGLSPISRFIHSHVAMKKIFFSRKSVKGLVQRSLLPQISGAWALLSESEKTDWSNAGAEMGLNGYRLFVADTSARIKNGLPGIATPSLLHQSWVGMLSISDPASEIKITQLHPETYWVNQKVSGSKGMFEPVVVIEDISLPLEISLNYKSELTSLGAGSFAKFYANVWRSYQGVDYLQSLEISLDLSSDWKNATATLSSITGQLIGYSLIFHIYNCRGTLYFDNVKATHSGQNWVRDPYCKDIDQGFTKAFFQIPKHWAALILPSGSEYDSIYKDF